MNVFVKLGLSILAGAAVMFGINCAESKKKGTTTVGNESISSLEDSGISVTSSPEEKIQKEQSGGKFMESAKKTQITVEIVSKIVTCLYRVVLCINEIFVPNNSYRYQQGSFYQGTVII